MATLTESIEDAVVHVEDIMGKTFDYVIVGGGTAGLTLAARLSEDPNVSVAVLEEGGNNVKNPLITIPAQFGHSLGNTDLATTHMTSPQKNLNGRQYAISRGLGIGGSSGLNYFLWSKPPANDIDAWEKLGMEGWNWNEFRKYTMKAEGFIPPSDGDIEAYKLSFDKENYGTQGPLSIGFPATQTSGELRFHEALRSLGVPVVQDPSSGNITGVTMLPQTIDPRISTRSFSPTAYYLPNAQRNNLKVLLNARGDKVLFSEQKEGIAERTAKGVQFTHKANTYVVNAHREVILCAGTIHSSALLELSGIGNREILEPLGIPVVVHNPAVGSNVQEHLTNAVVYEVDAASSGLKTLDSLTDPEVAAQHMLLHEKNEGLYRTSIHAVAWLPLSTASGPSHASSLISALRAKLEELDIEGSTFYDQHPGLREQYSLQLDALERDDLPDCELIFYPVGLNFPGHPLEKGKSYVSVLSGLNHPFSRGSIHITSADPSKPPTIDTNVLEYDIDLDIISEGLKYARNLRNVEPLKSIIKQELAPGPEVQTDHELRGGVRDFITLYTATSNQTGLTNIDTSSSCSMLPRDKGGVVDANLKVYGTTNLCVGDISIIPLHVAAHTQAAAYGIAEKLADILKAARMN